MKRDDIPARTWAEETPDMGPAFRRWMILRFKKHCGRRYSIVFERLRNHLFLEYGNVLPQTLSSALSWEF
jgi:hypothetical protein